MWLCSGSATWHTAVSRLLRSRSSTCGIACRWSKWLGVPPRGRCARRGTPRRMRRPTPSVTSVLEEELEAVRREVTDLQRRLGVVEDQREALEEGALAVFRVVEPRAPMRVD